MFEALVSCALSTAKNLDASKLEYCEDRRIRWRTYGNISSWFDNWERDLVELGFASYDKRGQCVIPDNQLRFIINFDETCLSADGSEGRRGGRPEIILHDPRLPMAGKAINKDSLTATMITGSNAAGEALVPHLGCYAALMKRTAVASVLDFTDEEWESLVALKEADAANRSNTAVANATDNIAGGLLTENVMIGGESGVV